MKKLEQSYKRPRPGFLELVGYYGGEGKRERERERERENAIVVKVDQDGEEKLMFRFKSVSPRVSFGRRGTNFVLGGLKRLLPRRSWSALYVA